MLSKEKLFSSIRQKVTSCADDDVKRQRGASDLYNRKSLQHQLINHAWLLGFVPSVSENPGQAQVMLFGAGYGVFVSSICMPPDTRGGIVP